MTYKYWQSFSQLSVKLKMTDWQLHVLTLTFDRITPSIDKQSEIASVIFFSVSTPLISGDVCNLFGGGSSNLLFFTSMILYHDFNRSAQFAETETTTSAPDQKRVLNSLRRLRSVSKRLKTSRYISKEFLDHVPNISTLLNSSVICLQFITIPNETQLH